MNHESKFFVSRFRNRNGVFSFRVDGSLNGVRIRRNFKTQEEAAAEKAALEQKALQLTSNLHPIVTSLSEDQVREAESPLPSEPDMMVSSHPARGVPKPRRGRAGSTTACAVASPLRCVLAAN